MTETVTRTYIDDDAAAIADLFNVISAAAGTRAYDTEEKIREDMTSGWLRDPGRDTRLLVAPDGTLVGLGLVPTPPAGGDRVEMVGGIHPRWRGRGLGRELIAWQIERARESRAETAPDAPWFVEGYAVAGEDDTVRLFRRFGLKETRYFFDMEAPLTGDLPAPALPDGLRSVPFTADLTEALYAAHMEAFADLWGFQARPPELWVPMTVGSQTFRPELSRIGYDGDEIAGYVLAYDATAGNMYVGQVGTRRPWRKRGLAGALLAESMRAAATAGRTLALLGVDADSPTGAVGVYERIGYHIASRVTSYRLHL